MAEWTINKHKENISFQMGRQLRQGNLEHVQTAKIQTRLRIFAVRLHNIKALLKIKDK